MRRREFIVAVGGTTLIWPIAARAQQSERMRRVAVLMNFAEGDPLAQANLLAFRQVLRELGWTEGRNIQFDYRWAAADADRTKNYAVELVNLTPDAIVANTLPVAAALKKATTTIPIVIAFGGDPVAAGLVNNQAHPGGNITGFTVTETPIAGKWLELLKVLAADATRVAIIRAPENPNVIGYVRAIEAANTGQKLELTQLDASPDIGRAIDVFAHGSKGALLVLPGPRPSFIARRSLQQQPAAGYPRFIRSAFLPTLGGSRRTEQMRLMSFVGRRRILIEYFAARKLAIFQSRNRRSSSSSSTS